MIAFMSGAIGLAELAVILSVCLTIVFPFWRICSKAGFQGALSLLMLVPIANIILPFYLALAEWPALKARGDVNGG